MVDLVQIDFTDIVFLIALSVMFYFGIMILKKSNESNLLTNKHTNEMIKSLEVMMGALQKNQIVVNEMNETQKAAIKEIEDMTLQLKNVCEISEKLKLKLVDLKDGNKK